MTYKIIYSKRRTISLLVNSQAELVVRAPKRVSQLEIEKILHQKMSWIKKTLAKAKTLTLAKKEFVPGEMFLYLGQQYPLHIMEGFRSRLVFDSGFYISKFYLPKARKLFEDFYRTEAQKVLIERANYHSIIMGVKFNRLTIRRSATRWGSCSSLGNINFSWRLVLAPLPVLDYVVVHELAHIIHKNHSQNFWLMVEQFCPEFKDLKRFLHENGPSLSV